MEGKVCVNASNPYHVCADYCSGNKSSPHTKSRPTGAGGRTSVQHGEKASGGGGGERRHVDPSCVNASNPFHQCSDYCNGKTPDAKKRIEAGRAVVAAHNGVRSKPAGEGRHVDPSCVNASNPFHQCGENCAQRMNKGRKKDSNNEISELEGNDVGIERNVGSQCMNASDPVHQCAVSCPIGSPGSTSSGSTSSGSTRLAKTSALGSLLAAESVKETKEKLALRVDGKADPSCKNASNPFHVCAYYCSQRSNDMDRVEKVKSVSANESRTPKHAVQRRAVDPRCPNAGNPFHVCAEYCFEKIREAT